MQPSFKLPILSSSNTLNYILIALNPHILHISFTKLFTLKIGGNLNINLSPFPYTSIQNPQDFTTTYTYWDYQQAWFIAFLLQNHNHSHSWLLCFYNTMNTTNLPLWFLQWWDYYSCHVDYLKLRPSFG
jgi:hypothetical protein